jgi:hypothetical protein
MIRERVAKLNCSFSTVLLKQVAIIGIAVGLSVSRLSAAQLEAEHVIQVIEGYESKIQNLKWASKLTQGQLKSPSNVSGWQMSAQTPIRINANVIVDAENNSYAVQFDSILQRFDQVGDDLVASYNAKRAAFFLDGDIFRNWQTDYDGEDTSKEPIGGNVASMTLGEITRGDSNAFGLKSFLQVYGQATLIYWMPPNFNLDTTATPEKLSTQLRENLQLNRRLDVEEIENGHWRITTFGGHLMGYEKSTETEVTVEVTFDASNGTIESCRWYRDFSSKGEDDFLLKELRIQNRPINDIWIPEEFVQVEWNTKEHRMIAWKCDGVEVNQELSDDAFKIEFPKGTRLTDHINQQYYVVGTGALDEQRSVRAYAERNGLKRNVPLASESSGFSIYRLLFLFCNAVFVIVLLIFVVRRRMSAGAVILFLACVAPDDAELALAAQPEQEITTPETVLHEESNVTPCGLRAGLFVLDLYNKRYDPKAVAASLPPTASGVNMADLQTVLQGLNWCHPPNVDCYLKARNRQGDYWCGEKRFSKGLRS